MDFKKHRKPQLLFIRHAKRFVVKNLETHHHVLLTGKGKKDALRFGKRIAMYHDNVVIFHSPIERCIQTAEHICKGIVDKKHCTIGGTVPVLGGNYLAKNQEFILDYFNRYGNIAFLKKWFDNEFDEDIIIPYGEVAHMEMLLIIEQLDRYNGLVIDVTHDWNIVVLLEYYFKLRFENTGIPGYLDGIAAYREDGDICLYHKKHSCRINRNSID
jgi:hypothetical protein